jgi:anaerobic magnesium-protoporphyrin IX monomethyl ester cyclase
VIGFSIIASRDIFNSIGIMKQARAAWPNKKIIAGGQAGTYYYERLLTEGADFVVHKEAERTLVDLLDAIDEGISDFSGIKGISYKSNGNIVTTESREFVKSLDETPFPRFDLMPKRKSVWFPGRYTGSIETSRGCPHSCNFCAITSFWDGSFRQKSNERILEEMRRLKSEGRTHIYLADDNFGVHPKKHMGLFEEMLRLGLDIKFFTQIRADTVARNEEMIALASMAGLYGVLVGFDTYNPETFDAVSKLASVSVNQQCSDILRKHHIAIFGTHIYGLPDQQNPEDFKATFELGRKNSDLFRMPHFSPLPFTRGYSQLVGIDPKDPSVIVNRSYQRDFRPRVGDKYHQAKMKKGYDQYMRKHNFSFSEINGALFHPDPIVRRFKRQGYISTARHKLYATLRKFRITDI